MSQSLTTVNFLKDVQKRHCGRGCDWDGNEFYEDVLEYDIKLCSLPFMSQRSVAHRVQYYDPVELKQLSLPEDKAFEVFELTVYMWADEEYEIRYAIHDKNPKTLYYSMRKKGE